MSNMTKTAAGNTTPLGGASDEVTVRKGHCKNTRYDSRKDCPLHRALKEQHPDLNVVNVFVDGFETEDGSLYDFDETVYSREAVRELMFDRGNSIVVKFKKSS